MGKIVRLLAILVILLNLVKTVAIAGEKVGLIWEKEFTESIQDVVFGEAEVTVRKAVILGVKGLEGKEPSNKIKVKYPRTIVTTNKIKFFDKEGIEEKTLLLEDFGYKTSAQISQDGKKIFVHSFIKNTKREGPPHAKFFILDENGFNVLEKTFENYPHISGNGKYIADFDDFGGGVNCTFYNIQGQQLWKKQFHQSWVGKLLYDGKIILADHKGTLTLLNTDGKELWTYNIEIQVPDSGFIHTAYSQEGGNIFTIENKEKVFVFNDYGLLWEKGDFGINEIYLSSEGIYLCGIHYIDKYLWLIDVTSGDFIWKYPFSEKPIIRCFDISEQGKTLFIIWTTKEKVNQDNEKNNYNLSIFNIEGNLIYEAKIPYVKYQTRFINNGQEILLNHGSKLKILDISNLRKQ